ncbi:MAG: heavy metal-associated domain-containing protein [Polyangiaceae bacterium]|jgi:copper chaperone
MAVKTITLDIGGMSCDGCVRSVRGVLSRLPGISQLEVDVGSAKLTLDDSKSSEDDVTRALDRAGFHPSLVMAS